MKMNAFVLVAGIPALTMALAFGAEEAPKEGGKKKGNKKAAREGRGDRGRGNWGRQRRNPVEEEMRLVGVRDAACLGLAHVHVAKQAPDKAIAVLQELIKDSADENAKGFARLSLARIYKSQKKEAEAADELKKVKGLGVIRAIDMLLQGVEDRTAKLEELLKEAKEPLAKAVIIRRLIREYARKRDDAKLADLVERTKKLLTAKEAAKAHEDELKLALAGAGGGAPGQRGGGMPDREEMQQRVNKMRTRMKDRIAELEKEGKKEEAEKLRERMERMEKMIKRFREGRGRGGRDRGGRDGGGEGKKPEPKIDAEEF